MNEEWWRMNEEWWRMNNEWWMMKDDDFKLLRGFADWRRDRTDVCDCRVAFATENSNEDYRGLGCEDLLHNNDIESNEIWWKSMVLLQVLT